MEHGIARDSLTPSQLRQSPLSKDFREADNLVQTLSRTCLSHSAQPQLPLKPSDLQLGITVMSTMIDYHTELCNKDMVIYYGREVEILKNQLKIVNAKEIASSTRLIILSDSEEELKHVLGNMFASLRSLNTATTLNKVKGEPCSNSFEKVGSSIKSLPGSSQLHLIDSSVNTIPLAPALHSSGDMRKRHSRSLSPINTEKLISNIVYKVPLQSSAKPTTTSSSTGSSRPARTLLSLLTCNTAPNISLTHFDTGVKLQQAILAEKRHQQAKSPSTSGFTEDLQGKLYGGYPLGFNEGSFKLNFTSYALPQGGQDPWFQHPITLGTGTIIEPFPSFLSLEEKALAHKVGIKSVGNTDYRLIRLYH
ncbi:hypothetical protein CONCODRAFT_10308 [Conidiobolus coronatus NRRL 28638]|uniref:Uncharacterized protein n=1 Tax=Conidiobolus coronatus (strain ATCC 28846 / CBS 209.66 / NRRL 28638) TaxID=796925 RepID=A0A137NXM7_CONC2|nr:hypothetical protein CONCODRAFT_10308 [Conidiobolus coronatus NRRL 28638]|eukprot:KXN67613.1 hypothetical protein CONCODRAFT_10308 [Conidiobolus coronatus NRRL 28638]